MALHFAGYFPKRIAPRPDWLQAPTVRRIASVSTCVSPAPEGWWEAWKHNAASLFDTPALAESVIPLGERGAYTLFAFRLWARAFDQGEERALPLALPPLDPPGPGFEPLGFDAVSREYDFFGHSPLSCNGAASTFAANADCLFPTLEAARTGARAFSQGRWEPGPYWVVEVLAERRP